MLDEQQENQMPRDLENMEMPMPEGEEEDLGLEEDMGMDFSDYSDEELLMAVDEAKSRGLMGGGEEAPPELEEGMVEEEELV